jgi:CRP-like cAMP-binding protein
VRRHTRHLSLYDIFNQGFEEIDFLDTLIHTLQDMERTVLKHLVRQLEHDRQTLVDSMISFLQAASRNERQVGAIVWTFRHSQDPREQERAYQSLQNLLSPIHARQLREAIQPVTHREKRIQTILPRIVWETLLEQQDEWRPLLTLYALAGMKEIQGNTDDVQLGLGSDAVQEVLERTDQSKYDVIRESSRFIQDLLEARVVKPIIDEAGLIHHQHQDLEGEVMLSTLERMLFLRDVSFFANLRLDQLRALARVCEEHSFPENKTLIRQGDSGDGLYILVEGRVRVERRQTDRDDSVTVATLNAPEVVGEISLLDGGMRTADVISETPVLLLHVKRATLDNALEDDPSIAMTMMRAMAQRLRMVTESFDKTLPEPASPDDKPIEEFVQNI